jgi:predicted small integral membrane protein
MGDWFADNIGWMYWTAPSGIAIGGLLLAIAGMAVWDRVSPSATRAGFLPMETTRGDRFFIAVMSLIGIHLIWLAVLGTSALWVATIVAVLWCGLLARWG